jgi:pimeloyl-ACP methyl ester carboxylesterase
MNGPTLGAPSPAQAALIAALPAVIGNLGGVAYWARDTANRITLTQRIAAAEKAVVDAKAGLPWGGIGGYGAGIGVNWATEEYLSTKSALDALTAICEALRVARTGGRRSILSLSDDTPPLAAVSIGDLDTADNVTYNVPGMGADTTSMTGWADAAQRLRDAQLLVTDRGISPAVVAWIGYRAPTVPMSPEPNLDVFGDTLARAGGEGLARDLRGWNAVREGAGASLNVVGHSYGTTTAAYALLAHDLNVGAFVSLGSAGMPTSVGTANDLQVGHVFAGQARDVIPAYEDGEGDQWAWIGRSGSGRRDPIDSDFGATRFGTDGNSALRLSGVTDHSTSMPAPDHGYLDNRTESLYNAALATTNQPDRLTPHVDQGVTDKQKRLVDASETYLQHVR